MLTSSNQYLRPEYLTPLPTTLDAKKSPLALLAQTCSQIGADAPNAKLLQSVEKSSKKSLNDSTKDKTAKCTTPPSSNNNNKPSYKPYESTPLLTPTTINREKSRSPEDRLSNASSTGSCIRTPVSTKNGPSLNGRCGSNNSATSPRASPANSDNRKTPGLDIADGQRTPSKSPLSPKLVASTASSSLPTTDIIKDIPLGTYKPSVTLPPVSSAAYLGYPSAGLPLGMDLMTSSLISQHHAALKAGLNPYLNYAARLKTPGDPLSGAPMCRDPYCTGCSLNSHLLNAAAVAAAAVSAKTNGQTQAACPAGCTQCDHAASGNKGGFLSGHSPAAAAFAHAQLAALAAASHLPYVCNWISGDSAYCGKRFSSSEELLTHLRTHTSVASVSDVLSASAAGLPPTHPLLHRTYPTAPLSPLSTARYHPYSKPILPPSPLSNYPLTHPGIPPYLSPYSLYGPRLGATPGMHP